MMIDLNKASVKDLLQLTGVGEKLAENIFTYIQDKGPLTQADDLLKVKGITPKLLETLKPNFVISIPTDKRSEQKAGGQSPVITISNYIPFYWSNGVVSGAIPPPKVAKKAKLEFAIELSAEDTLVSFNPNLLVLKYVIHPNQSRNLQIKFPVPKITPPGVYYAKISHGDYSFQAQFEIYEIFSVDFAPQEIMIRSNPGQKVEKMLHIRNLGNSPVQFAVKDHLKLFPATIEPEQNLILEALKESKIKHFNDFLASVSEVLKKNQHVPKGSPLKVKSDNPVIDPGKTVGVPVVFEIPAHLEMFGHYKGVLQFYNAKASVDVFPVKKVLSSSPK